MKPFCFLLFATTVLQTTEGQSQGQGQSQSQSETQSQGLSLSQSLTCGPTNRGGKSLGSPRWKPQLPSSCRQASSASSAALCDEPGADYPWEAIDNYLRRSSSQAKKRALASRSRPASGAKTPPRGSASAPNSPRGNGAAEESTLRADSGTAPSTPRVTSDLADGAAAPGFPPGDSSGGVSNSLRRRRGRSAVAVATENVREKKDIGPPPARQRVTTRRTPPPRPTTWEPELDGFTELVYVTDTYRQHGEANVTKVTAWETVRQTTSFPPRPSMPTPTTTPTPTPDPYTESACSYREEVRSPFFARNTRYEWKTLINMPNYETFIHMEHCVEEQSQGRCAAGCRCTQKYTVRTMPVYDRDSNGCDTIYMDKFLFPSHCDCKCLPVTHLFHAGRRPTSALPSVERPPKPSFARPPPGEFGREHEWVRERERERGKERERNQEMEMEMEMEREREREMERERQREREKGRERQQERERGRGREKERADPPDGYRPSPAVARPRAPSRRRPAVIVPPEAEKPVPPRVPIVPSDAPVLNHRNWQRGPQDTPPDHRQRRAVSR
ncbi:protein split ends-like isoform X2 [Pollicipes pollicipes]|uniref:protein split ends-like isoform X2 n=1 Tax=Pollicipes pollicipes TaxID=41117 RepID=UPI0018858E6D|nr:protein split ends-like isoform X2 [Pollicipes pollicipes]